MIYPLVHGRKQLRRTAFRDASIRLQVVEDVSVPVLFILRSLHSPTERTLKRLAIPQLDAFQKKALQAWD
jgi:hypothetical protein